jgi:hypothetical protein
MYRRIRYWANLLALHAVGVAPRTAVEIALAASQAQLIRWPIEVAQTIDQLNQKLDERAAGGKAGGVFHLPAEHTRESVARAVDHFYDVGWYVEVRPKDPAKPYVLDFRRRPEVHEVDSEELARATHAIRTQMVRASGLRLPLYLKRNDFSPEVVQVLMGQLHQKGWGARPGGCLPTRSYPVST